MAPAKYAPAVAPAVAAAAAAHAQFLISIAAVLGGLTLGAMWRAGSLRSEGRDWRAVRGDLTISALIGGANAVLTLAMVEWLGLGVMLSMALGVVIGATGLRALPEIRDALIGTLRRKLLDDDLITRIDPRALPPDIEAKARQLNEGTDHD